MGLREEEEEDLKNKLIENIRQLKWVYLD